MKFDHLKWNGNGTRLPLSLFLLYGYPKMSKKRSNPFSLVVSVWTEISTKTTRKLYCSHREWKTVHPVILCISDCSETIQSTNKLNCQQLKSQFLSLYTSCFYCINTSTVFLLIFEKLSGPFTTDKIYFCSDFFFLKVKLLKCNSADDTADRFIWLASFGKHHTGFTTSHAWAGHLSQLCQTREKASADSSVVLWNTLVLFRVWQKTGPCLFAGYKPRD